MNLKARPNHRRYVEILRRMTPAQRLDKALELTEYARALMKAALRTSHPHMPEHQLHQIYLERLRRCHNQNY